MCRGDFAPFRRQNSPCLRAVGYAQQKPTCAKGGITSCRDGGIDRTRHPSTGHFAPFRRQNHERSGMRGRSSPVQREVSRLDVTEGLPCAATCTFHSYRSGHPPHQRNFLFTIPSCPQKRGKPLSEASPMLTPAAGWHCRCRADSTCPSARSGRRACRVR